MPLGLVLTDCGRSQCEESNQIWQSCSDVTIAAAPPAADARADGAPPRPTVKGATRARGEPPPAAAPPEPTAAWDFAGDAPFTDRVHGYALRQHNASAPVAIVRAPPPFARAAAFG